jgi:predicted DNA-binding protein YlxM (UPF0122 family)
MDNKNAREGRDRSRVAGNEQYEVQHIAEKFNVSPEEVRKLIKEVGNDRKTLEERLSARR